MGSYSRLFVLSTKEDNSAFRRTRRHLLYPRSSRPLAGQKLLARPCALEEVAAEEVAPWAAAGQAGKDKHAAGEAKHWAATGQADKDKHAGVSAAQFAPRSRADTPRQFFHALPLVPLLLPPPAL